MLTESIFKEDIFIYVFSPDTYSADKPAVVRNGGVYLYFKESLPIKARHDHQKLLKTIVAEIKLNRKKPFFVLS